jgi:hypothetical protein
VVAIVAAVYSVNPKETKVFIKTDCFSSLFNSLYVCFCNSKATLCLTLAIAIKFVASVKTLEAKEVYPKIYVN